MDTLPSPTPPITLGLSSLESIEPGFPADQNAAWPTSWLETYTFLELPTADIAGTWDGGIADVWNPVKVERRWGKVGCFDRAVDWFGDGSLWFLDAPGVGRLRSLPSVRSG